MKETMKNTLLLTAITLIAGILLGVVHEVTAGPIEEQERIRQEAACETVFPEADSFDTDYEMTDDGTVKGFAADQIDSVIPALDDKGEILGYVLTITSGEGYGGDIQFMLGIQNSGEVNGIAFLSISETAGLGMKAKEPAFMDQFAGKTVEQFSYTKSGASAENEIDAISGATITTNAVTNGVNAGLSCFYTELSEDTGIAADQTKEGE